MRQVLRERARLVAALQGLVRIAQSPQSVGVNRQGRYPRVLAIGEGERAVLLGIVQRDALGKMLAGLSHLPHEVQRQAQSPVGYHEGAVSSWRWARCRNCSAWSRACRCLPPTQYDAHRPYNTGKRCGAPRTLADSHARANVCSTSGEA